jgi:hypothetical protein
MSGKRRDREEGSGKEREWEWARKEDYRRRGNLDLTICRSELVLLVSSPEIASFSLGVSGSFSFSVLWSCSESLRSHSIMQKSEE